VVQHPSLGEAVLQDQVQSSDDGMQMAKDQEPIYSSDQPIRSKGQDRFNRWPFAQRVAETLAGRTDSSSLVIGIYGPWGDGKSSTLFLMEEALAKQPNVLRVRFNPWHFDSEEQLLRGFFATLSDALGDSLSTRGEDIGRLLKQYGSVLSVASISVAGAQLGLGDAAKGLGEALSTVTLDKLRGRLETLLREQGKRIVIFIDDIDRLDRREIQSIFRVIKLSGSFNYISYVLAFDDKMVAAALGERYGEGNVEAGRAFLEKIVQVPLHLPPADRISLRKMTFEGVDSAIRLSGIDLSQEQVEAFVQHFVDGLESRLTTPRQARLFVNVLQFALPILKGEVHPVDHMLLEGIRIFYPKLYVTIRDNPEYFLKADGGGGHDDSFRKRASELIDSALQGMGIIDKALVRQRLLEVLFPRLKNTVYMPDWDERWHREQRICSTDYFQRYFSYGVPPGDVPDLKVNELLEIAGSSDEGHLVGMLKDIAETNGIARLISKLRLREQSIESQAAARLALALSRNGSLVPREKQMFISDWTVSQAAILVTNLVQQRPVGKELEDLARQIINEAEPLAFAFECLRWFRKGTEQPEENRVLAPEVEEELGSILADRVRSEASKGSLYRNHGTDAPRLLWIWDKHANDREVESYLSKRFEKDPAEVDDFLAVYVGRAWGMESGLSHVADFTQDNYDAVKKLISPDLIFKTLKGRYGSEIDSPQYHHNEDIPVPRRIAHQFASIYSGSKKQEGA
jgi:hypothetical protein